MYAKGQMIGITFIMYAKGQMIGITFIMYAKGQMIGKQNNLNVFRSKQQQKRQAHLC